MIFESIKITNGLAKIGISSVYLVITYYRCGKCVVLIDIDMKEKYKFKKLDWKHDKILICPACFETLFRSDIEHFQKCPYCNSSIELNAEIEDYLLKPAVDKWIMFQSLTLPQYSLDFPPQR